MDRIRKTKYLHILWHPDIKYNPKFVQMINCESSFFNQNEHLFITPYQNVYEKIKQFPNTVLAGNPKKNLINEFGDCGDLIFVHAMNCNFIQVAFTKTKYAKKVVWRTWGHDLRPLDYYKKSRMKHILASVFWPKYVSKVQQFKGIGLGASFDASIVKTVFGTSVATYDVRYSYEPEEDKIRESVKNSIIERESTYNVLIGHSASRTDNHFEIIDYLKRFANEDITVYLILSYGDSMEYRERIRQYATEKLGNKIVVIDHFMDYEQFCKFLKKMDCIFFNQTYSSALGVLKLSLFFEKMVYFNKNGLFAKVLRDENILIHTCDDVGKMKFEEFVSTKPSVQLIDYYGKSFTCIDCCRAMQKTLLQLEEK